MAKKIQAIFDEGDAIIDNAEAALLTSLDEAEKSIYREVIKIFNEVDISSGKFVSTDKARRFLLSLDNRIIEALYNSSYRLGVSDLLKDYNKITKNNIDLEKFDNLIQKYFEESIKEEKKVTRDLNSASYVTTTEMTDAIIEKLVD